MSKALWNFPGPADRYLSWAPTAFSTPTAAVVWRSKPWPMWSAWARVRSSNSISLGSLVLGSDCSRFFTSLVELEGDGRNNINASQQGGFFSFQNDEQHVPCTRLPEREREMILSSPAGVKKIKKT